MINLYAIAKMNFNAYQNIFFCEKGTVRSRQKMKKIKNDRTPQQQSLSHFFFYFSKQKGIQSSLFSSSQFLHQHSILLAVNHKVSFSKSIDSHDWFTNNARGSFWAHRCSSRFSPYFELTFIPSHFLLC